jgi:hypothetical protein
MNRNATESYRQQDTQFKQIKGKITEYTVSSLYDNIYRCALHLYLCYLKN